MTVTVIVPTHGGRDRVLRLLAALAQQTTPPDEVVVVADGDVDGTTDAVRAFAAPYALHVHAQPSSGRAAACNRGIAAATGDIVLILDDDMAPRADCVERHRLRHRDPGLGIVGAVPVVVPPGAGVATRYVARRFAEHGASLATGRPLGPRDFYSGHFSASRDALVAVGGFDDAFRRYGNEDVELFVRLRGAGLVVAYAAEAIADQAFEKDAATLVRDSHHKGWTAVQLAEAHPDAAAGTRLASWDDAGRRRRLLLVLAVELDALVPALARPARSCLRAADRRGLLPAPVLDLAADVAFWCGVRRALRAGGGRAGAAAVATRSRLSRRPG